MADSNVSGEAENSEQEIQESNRSNEEKNEEPEKSQPEMGISKKQRTKAKKKRGRKGKKLAGEKVLASRKKAEAKQSSPRAISSKSTFALIAKELKARRLAQMAHAVAMSKRRKKNRVLRDEEIYTDKDRAASVNMGTSDIKQSLKMKKKQDKNYDSQTPEEGDPATLLALGNNELRSGDLKIALNFINKALKLNPDDKNGLVARSKCYLSLGNPELALKDAETALVADKAFVRAIYQKAEALYHLGDFEHSLMYYHRGHRLRPELESFRLGVQKAQEAIENTIGTTSGVKRLVKENKTSSERSSANTARSQKPNGTSNEAADTKRSFNSLGGEKENKINSRSKSSVPTGKTPQISSKKFLGELGVDRLYLENLLKHPDLECSNQEAANLIKAKAEEGIIFLKSRQEFWEQQKPNIPPVGKKKNVTRQQTARC